MKIHHNISLKSYNTFGIDATASVFVEVSSVEALRKAIELYPNALPLGGGSNLLLVSDISFPIVKINTKGITVVQETSNEVFVEVSSGENWHQFVMYCLENDFGGVENLALIPGNVGTAPVQNIGAYGVEIKDVMYSCKAMNVQTGEIKTFTNAECEFQYRESIFKTSQKGKYIITTVTFRLTKNQHQIRTQYGAINTFLQNEGIENPSLKDVARAVISIRQSKLPDPKILGNSGSFFKNPVVEKSFYEELLKENPQMPHYEVSSSEVKIPAGWLIESCGLKGYRVGDAGVHQHQSLVLVNYGNASGRAIYDLAKFVQNTIFKKYHISLEMEVNVLGSVDDK